MSGAYNAWKAAHLALDGELGEDLKGALELAADALREPAKRARVSDLLRSYAAHVRGDVDEDDDGYREEDFVGLVADALSEFEQAAPASVPDGLPTRVLDALKAMEHLNYTGDHTHFEVLTDARQVLAEVMRGKAIPQLERFRCPSMRTVSRDIANDSSAGQLRCTQQLPHPGPHVNGPYSWDDAHSDNPPKSYDEPEPCGDKHTFRRGMLAGKTYTCVREAEHEGLHQSKGKSTWR